MCILGDGSTGKSTIIHMFRTEGFERVYKQTIGCDFYEKSLAIRSRDVSLKVWDIGGQSIHSKNIAAYVGSSHAVFLVYDVTNPESFNNLEDWLRVVRQHATASHVYLVGNKIDLLSLRQVTAAQHDKFIAEHGLQGGVFMSAKSGENVIRTFYQVAGEVVGLRLTAHELAFHDKVCVSCAGRGALLSRSHKIGPREKPKQNRSSLRRWSATRTRDGPPLPTRLSGKTAKPRNGKRGRRRCGAPCHSKCVCLHGIIYTFKKQVLVQTTLFTAPRATPVPASRWA
jgi:Ras-related protein Rab-28